MAGRARRRAAERAPEPADWERPPLPSSAGLLAPVVTHAFAEIEISVSLWVSDEWWHPIYGIPNVSRFEYEHGGAERRVLYNRRCLTRACQEKKAVVGVHAGFRDLFVPVIDRSKRVQGVFVAGPFAVARPTSTEVLERWTRLGGAQGRVGNALFSRYLATTLGTLTLEGKLQKAFERLLSCFADLVVGRGDAQALAARVESARSELARARLPEQMWQVTRGVLDAFALHTAVPLDHGEMAAVGLSAAPEHVVVGLFADRKDEADSIDALLRRDAFQRGCASWAIRRGDVVSGKVGDHGVVMLAHHAGAASRRRTALLDLAAAITLLARRSGLELHAGIGQGGGSESLPVLYRQALSAAEKALSQGLSVLFSEPQAERHAERMWELRNELGQSLGDRPEVLSPRFDRYIEDVLAHCGYRLETAKTHLAAGLERLAGALLHGGLLDRKGFAELCASMELADEAARTVAELVGSYRRLVSNIEAALRSPAAARQDRGTERALAFIREHLGERLTLERVARAAGYAVDYFAKLWKRSERVTLARHLCDLRVAKARQMLIGTNLTVEQIQALCGFSTRPHFHRVFKKRVGLTPIAYRNARRSGLPQLARSRSGP
jgi:AraC-like DNA-binding protein